MIVSDVQKSNGQGVATQPPEIGGKSRVANFVCDFIRRDEGTYTIFGVYMFLLIIMLGGIGIDLMRYERDRVNLQYTLDRAVLAAADLDQKQQPKDVVTDYMTKAGLIKYLGLVDVKQGLGYRIVSANASAKMKTQFMHMGGVDELKIPASSTAEERIGGVEISLVLDVSGSMNNNSRLTNLKVAAKDFVDQMDKNTQDGKLSISIVPYATQVSTPSGLINQFNVTKEQEHSNCVNFEANAFSTTTINQTDELKRTMHFSPWSYMDGRGNNPKTLIYNPVCEAKESRELLPLQKNATTLKNYITNLTAWGNTSIDLGVKWGVALLDPSLRAPVGELVKAGTIPEDFKLRPTDYHDGETLKVIVVMSDGQNTSQYYVRDELRGGKSGVWWHEADDVYSIHDPSDDTYYWSSDKNWHDEQYGTTSEWVEVQTTCKRWNKKKNKCRKWNTEWQENITVTSVEITNPELTAYTSLQYLADHVVGPARGYDWAWNKYYHGAFSAVHSDAKDTRTDAICSAAKNKGVVIFTIGFEAPSRGLSVLKKCASSASHFFDVEGLEISDAFSSIASSIRKLRLTQ